MAQVGTGDFKPSYDPKHAPMRKILDDRQSQQVVFDEEFQRSIEGIVGRERLDVAPHEVCGQNERCEVRRLRSEVNLFDIDDPQQEPLLIDDRQHGERRDIQTVNDRGQRILGTKGYHRLFRRKEFADMHLGQDLPDVASLMRRRTRAAFDLGGINGFSIRKNKG